MDGIDDKRDQVLKAALEYRTELVAYARSLLGNYTAADDVLQEAMLVLVKAMIDVGLVSVLRFRGGVTSGDATCGGFGGF